MTSNDEARDSSGRPRHSRIFRSLQRSHAIRYELVKIMQRAEAVASRGRHGFADGLETHDIASMAVIRLAAVIERGDFPALLTVEEATEIAAAREIAMHGGADASDDDLLWIVVTQRIPAIVCRLRGLLPPA